MTERADPEVTDAEKDAIEADQPEAGADSDTEPDDGTSHLDDIEDGAGCTEIWERLSERREE